MPQFTVMVDLSEGETREAEETAAFFRMTLEELLTSAVVSGIAHAADKRSDIESQMAKPEGRSAA